MTSIQRIEDFINGELQVIAQELIDEQNELQYQELMDAEEARLEEMYRYYYFDDLALEEYDF